MTYLGLKLNMAEILEAQKYYCDLYKQNIKYDKKYLLSFGFIIIVGFPSSGKTTLSNKILTSYGFAMGQVEGIYVRCCDKSKIKYRGKIVQHDFLTGNTHWSKQCITKNLIS